MLEKYAFLPLLGIVLCTHACIFSKDFGVAQSSGTGELLMCGGDDDCGGINARCVQGECVDLLSDVSHCGQINMQCNQGSGSECVAGLCTCGDLSPVVPENSASREIFSSSRDDFMIWPSAKLATFPSSALLPCDPEGEASCSEEGHDLGAPHFVAVGALNGVDRGSDRLLVQALDGRGEKVGSEVREVGDPMKGEVRLLHTKLVPFAADELKLFTMWAAQERDTHVITSYTIKANDSGGIQVQRDELPWVSQKHMTDFTVVLGVDESVEPARLIVSVLVTIARDGDLAKGALLVRGHAFQDNQGELMSFPIQGTPFPVPNMGQVLTDFGATLSTSDDGMPEIHAVVLNGEHHEGLYTAKNEPFGFNQSYYNHHVFSLEQRGEFIEAISQPTQRMSLGSTIVNSLDLLGLSVGGNRSVLPPPFFAFWATGALNVLGWSRVRDMGDDISTFGYRSVGATRSSVDFDNPLKNAVVYDSALAFEGEEDLYVHRVEATVNNIGQSSDMARLKLAPLVTGSSPQLGSARDLSPDIAARRISVATSPHATGVLATIRQGNNGGKAELFFVVDGDEPVCNPIMP